MLGGAQIPSGFTTSAVGLNKLARIFLTFLVSFREESLRTEKINLGAPGIVVNLTIGSWHPAREGAYPGLGG